MFIILQKALSFFKNYWYVPISLSVAVLFFLVTRNKKSFIDWAKTFSDATIAHNAEIKSIEKAVYDRKVADDQAYRRSVEVRRQIYEEFERNQREIDVKQQKRIEQITRKLKNNPQAMADAIERETGIRVMIIE